MPPPELQIYLRPRVTFDVDLLTPTLVVSCPCPLDHLCLLAWKSLNSLFQYRVHKRGKRWTDGRTDTRTDWRTDERMDNLKMHSLVWRRYNKTASCLSACRDMTSAALDCLFSRHRSLFTSTIQYNHARSPSVQVLRTRGQSNLTKSASRGGPFPG